MRKKSMSHKFIEREGEPQDSPMIRAYIQKYLRQHKDLVLPHAKVIEILDRVIPSDVELSEAVITQRQAKLEDNG